MPWLACRSGDEGGFFLTASPGETHTVFNDVEFRTALRFRLGVPVNGAEGCAHRGAEQHTSSKRCPKPLDKWGSHAILCKLGGGVTPIHDAICDILHGAARAAGFRALREQVVS